MGAWGTEPKDNDGAWNLLHELDKPLDVVLEKVYRKTRNYSEDRWATVGLVQLLLERGFGCKLALAKRIRADLARCLCDADWVAQWKNPKELRRSGARIGRALGILIDEEEQSRDRMKKSRRYQRYLARGGKPASARVNPWYGWPKPPKRSFMGLGAKTGCSCLSVPEPRRRLRTRRKRKRA